MTGRSAYVPTEKPRDTVEERIRNALARGAPLSLEQLAERTGKRRGTIVDALARMHKRGEVEPAGSSIYRVWRTSGVNSTAEA